MAAFLYRLAGSPEFEPSDAEKPTSGMLLHPRTIARKFIGALRLAFLKVELNRMVAIHFAVCKMSNAAIWLLFFID